MSHILVAPASLLDPADFVGGIQTDPCVLAHYWGSLFGGDALAYADRDNVETDENFVQLIPYVVLARGEEVFAYRRTPAGGEARLHHRWSLGVGGHVERADGPPSEASYGLAYHRELFEEVGLAVNADNAKPGFCGLVYDRSDAVGRVHLGLVHRLDVPDEFLPLRPTDPALAAGEWMTPAKLAALRPALESWSRLVLDRILAARPVADEVLEVVRHANRPLGWGDIEWRLALRRGGRVGVGDAVRQLIAEGKAKWGPGMSVVLA